MMKPIVRDIRPEDVAACAELLRSLPEWFGLADSNREYIEGLSHLPAAVSEAGERINGFVSVRAHNARSAEIVVMAVRRDCHRQGVGRALLGWVEEWCTSSGIAWLHVKTRGPSTPDPSYEKTRQFYLAEGFDPLFESLTLWGPEDAALILVKAVPSRVNVI